MAKSEQSRSRFARISLRTFLAVIVGFSILLAVKATRVRSQRAIVDRVEELGGAVNYRHGREQDSVTLQRDNDGLVSDWQLPMWVSGPGGEPLAPRWLRTFIGEDYFRRLELVQLQATAVNDDDLRIVSAATSLRTLELQGTNVTDDSLPYVGKLRQLRALNLGGTQITDEGLKHLAELRNLEFLTLSCAGIKGDGIKHLQDLDNLKVLYIGAVSGVAFGSEYTCPAARVTDSSVQALTELSGLQLINISGTAISEKGEQELREALPSLTIWR